MTPAEVAVIARKDLVTTRWLRLLSIACCLAAPATACDASSRPDPDLGGGNPALQETLAPAAREGDLALQVETIADGLDHPWSIAFLPDGRMLVTERAGRLRVIREGQIVEEPVSGTPEPYVRSQAGYFDVLPHPDFAQNQVVFLAYAAGTAKNNGLRVARALFDGAALRDFRVIYEAQPLKDTPMHYGGRLVWGPDDKLYVTVGEGARYRDKAQDLTTSFGAVVRLNEDGSVPADNPDFGLASGESALPELYSKGHRNAQGLAYDAERGVLWEHEHGPRGGDEINIIEPGANYGWPFATYGVEYGGDKVSPFTEYRGTVQPVKYWTPSIAPSGLAVYRGDLFEGWDGDLLVGALAGRALHRVILDGDVPVGEERYLVGERVRDVRVGPDGAIYVTTEESNEPAGRLLRLTPR
jgi:glucose/arabinose dehydrogenase